MLVMDSDVPYPRQYVQTRFLSNDYAAADLKYSGYMVPFAGAPAYWYWWVENPRFLHTNQKTEAELQSNKLFAAIRCRHPDRILPQLLRS